MLLLLVWQLCAGTSGLCGGAHNLGHFGPYFLVYSLRLGPRASQDAFFCSAAPQAPERCRALLKRMHRAPVIFATHCGHNITSKSAAGGQESSTPPEARKPLNITSKQHTQRSADADEITSGALLVPGRWRSRRTRGKKTLCRGSPLH